MTLYVASDEECEGVAVAGSSFSGQMAKGVVAAISDGANDTEEGEGESMFSKLEKTRTMLETSLGLASLLEAYTLIQVATFIVHQILLTILTMFCPLNFRLSMKIHLEVMRSQVVRSCFPRSSWLPLLAMRTYITAPPSSTWW